MSIFKKCLFLFTFSIFLGLFFVPKDIVFGTECKIETAGNPPLASKCTKQYNISPKSGIWLDNDRILLYGYGRTGKSVGEPLTAAYLIYNKTNQNYEKVLFQDKPVIFGPAIAASPSGIFYFIGGNHHSSLWFYEGKISQYNINSTPTQVKCKSSDVSGLARRLDIPIEQIPIPTTLVPYYSYIPLKIGKSIGALLKDASAVMAPNGKIYIFGGYYLWNNRICFSSQRRTGTGCDIMWYPNPLNEKIFEYNPQTNEFKIINTLPTNLLRYNAPATLGKNGKIYIFPGITSPIQPIRVSSGPTCRVYGLSTSSDSFLEAHIDECVQHNTFGLSTGGPAPKGAGIIPEPYLKMSNNIIEYDPLSNTVLEKKTTLPFPSFFTIQTASPLYDSEGRITEYNSSVTHTFANYFIASGSDGYIYIFGGKISDRKSQEENYSDKIYAYDPVKDKLQELSIKLPEKMYEGFAIGSSDGYIYVWGQGIKSGTMIKPFRLKTCLDPIIAEDRSQIQVGTQTSPGSRLNNFFGFIYGIFRSLIK